MLTTKGAYNQLVFSNSSQMRSQRVVKLTTSSPPGMGIVVREHNTGPHLGVWMASLLSVGNEQNAVEASLDASGGGG